MLAFGFGMDSPRAASHRFMNLISSDCEVLIRAPRDRRSLFCVWDGIIAVISTACAWCRIIPCMNFMSAFDSGGNVPCVDGGSVLLGVPGAPGCTITGCDGAPCCAETAEQKKSMKMLAIRNARCAAIQRELELSLRCWQEAIWFDSGTNGQFFIAVEIEHFFGSRYKTTRNRKTNNKLPDVG
jgi:hypothetical protein